MRSVPLPFLSKITLLWTRAREPGPVSPVKVDSPLPFPWTQRGEIYTSSQTSQFPRGMAAWTSSTGTGCVFLCIVRQPPGSELFPPLGYFRKKEKHLLASLPKREAAPCAFAAARPPTQADWPAGKSFQFLSQFTTSHRYVLSIFVETPPFFSFHAVGETFLVSVLSNHLHAGNWAAPEGGFFWETLTKKIPATSAGTKTSE